MTLITDSFLIAGLLLLAHGLIVSFVIRTPYMLVGRVSPVMIHAASAKLMLFVLASLVYLEFTFNFWISFCVLAFGVSAFLFLYGAVYKSLSIRLLLRAQDAGGKLDINALDFMVTQPSFTDRVNILNAMGCVRNENSFYQLTARGHRLVSRIIMIRKYFRVNTTGLY